MHKFTPLCYLRLIQKSRQASRITFTKIILSLLSIFYIIFSRNTSLSFFSRFLFPWPPISVIMRPDPRLLCPLPPAVPGGGGAGGALF